MVGYTSQMGKQATSNFEAKKKSRVLWNNPTLTTTFCDPWVDEIQGGHRNNTVALVWDVGPSWCPIS